MTFTDGMFGRHTVLDDDRHAFVFQYKGMVFERDGIEVDLSLLSRIHPGIIYAAQQENTIGWDGSSPVTNLRQLEAVYNNVSWIRGFRYGFEFHDTLPGGLFTLVPNYGFGEKRLLKGYWFELLIEDDVETPHFVRPISQIDMANVMGGPNVPDPRGSNVAGGFASLLLPDGRYSNTVAAYDANSKGIILDIPHPITYQLHTQEIWLEGQPDTIPVVGTVGSYQNAAYGVDMYFEGDTGVNRIYVSPGDVEHRSELMLREVPTYANGWELVTEEGATSPYDTQAFMAGFGLCATALGGSNDA
jgi:hypothetical protein